MIKSKIIKISKTEVFDDEYIESELRKNGYEPVRWAIVDVCETSLYISVSYNL